MLSLVEDFHSKPILAECKALLRAMMFCMELGIDKVVLEGGAQVAIKPLILKTIIVHGMGRLSKILNKF